MSTPVLMKAYSRCVFQCDREPNLRENYYSWSCVDFMLSFKGCFLLKQIVLKCNITPVSLSWTNSASSILTPPPTY